MTRFKLFSAALILSAIAATPAFAQWQSQEPASYQAQYPNGDRNLGLTRPVADAHAMIPRLIMRHRLPATHAKVSK